MFRIIACSLLLAGCLSSQDESVVSASEYTAGARAKLEKYAIVTQDITEDTFLIIRQICMGTCISSGIVCSCKCNLGLVKLRQVTYSNGLKYVSQWDGYLDQTALTQKEEDDCKSF